MQARQEIPPVPAGLFGAQMLLVDSEGLYDLTRALSASHICPNGQPARGTYLWNTHLGRARFEAGKAKVSRMPIYGFTEMLCPYNGGVNHMGSHRLEGEVLFSYSEDWRPKFVQGSEVFGVNLDMAKVSVEMSVNNGAPCVGEMIGIEGNWATLGCDGVLFDLSHWVLGDGVVNIRTQVHREGENETIGTPSALLRWNESAEMQVRSDTVSYGLKVKVERVKPSRDGKVQ